MSAAVRADAAAGAGDPGRRRVRRATTGRPHGLVDAVALAEVRAALDAGAAPAAALAAAVARRRDASGVLGGLVAGLRAGQPLAELAGRIGTGDAAADLLVRALGVAERTGAGGAAAVDQALAAARDEADLARLLRSRTVQARGTAAILSAVPALAWLVLVAADRAALGFYTTALGALTGGLALVLAGLGQWWSRRLVAAAQRAGAVADPLSPQPARRDVRRMAALGVPALVLVGVAAGATAGLLAAGIAVALAARRPGRSAPVRGPASGGGAAEAVELVAVALTAGLSAPAAVTAVVALAPPAARGPLGDAARRLRNGWDPEAAFGDGGLAALGATLAVTERWGAPAAPALRRLAEDLRADRRAAVEEAAERTQLTLIFPTTLLTLPAFVLGVVPPLLWTAFAG